MAFDAGLQVFIHANGDAAIDDAITAVENAGIKAKNDRRTVVIHSQFQRPYHLDKYLELGMSPSYFINHTYFWGDVHIKNIGREKAYFISPLKSAKKKGLIYSNHTDFNITPLDPFFVIWSAMARISKNGEVVGPDERVDAYTALQGMTTGPAWQLFEEDRKGMIKEGLLAGGVGHYRQALNRYLPARWCTRHWYLYGQSVSAQLRHDDPPEQPVQTYPQQ